jgi:hypothetical protein
MLAFGVNAFFGRLASASNACCTSTNAANFVGTSGRLYFGASALLRISAHRDRPFRHRDRSFRRS